MTSDHLRLGAAVLLCGALLAGSEALRLDAPGDFRDHAVSQAEKAKVRRATDILVQGRSPLTGFTPCDGVKGLLPDRFTAAEGGHLVGADGGDQDVIVCVRDGFDYGPALSVATKKRLTWSSGLGGDRIVVFAPSQARFLQVAKANDIPVRPGDLTPFSLMLNSLRSLPGARADEVGGWLIDAAPKETKVIFGPYLDLSAGAYEASFVLEPKTPADCAALAQAVKAAATVTAEVGTRLLADKATLAATPGPGCSLRARLPFRLAQPAKAVETPLWITSPFALRLTGYDLAPAAAKP